MSSDRRFPESLATERLELRAYRPEDTASLRRLIDVNRLRLLRSFKELAQGLATADATQAYLSTCVRHWQVGQVFHYGIWTREPVALVGQIKIKNVQWDVPSGELSYFIDEASLRRGYAFEAVSAVIRHAVEELAFRRLYARIIASNAESLQLARKLGMKHEGLHQAEFRCGFGELHDVHYFAVTRPDN